MQENNKRIHLSPPHLGGGERKSLMDALESNWIAPVGPCLDEFEAAICRATGAEACSLINSATSAIHLALRLLEIGPGDLVFIQSHTHIGSVNPILYQGATPVFVDSVAGSWNMSSEHLQNAIEMAHRGEIKVLGSKGDLVPGRPACIIPVHLYGMPADMQAIMNVASTHNLPVVEDAAESLGSTYNETHTGLFGKIGVYSFNGNKIITTSGGGALVSSDRNLMERATFLATQANDPAPHFEHSEMGYNYRMSNILAALGKAQLKVLERRVSARREIFDRYFDYFSTWNSKGFNIGFQEESPLSRSNRWLSCIIVDPSKNHGITNDMLRLELEKANIESRPLWKPMHLQPVFRDCHFVGEGYSEKLFEHGLCLPSGSSLEDEDFERIFKVLDTIFDGVVIK